MKHYQRTLRMYHPARFVLAVIALALIGTLYLPLQLLKWTTEKLSDLAESASNILAQWAKRKQRTS